MQKVRNAHCLLAIQCEKEYHNTEIPTKKMLLFFYMVLRKRYTREQFTGTCNKLTSHDNKRKINLTLRTCKPLS